MNAGSRYVRVTLWLGPTNMSLFLCVGFILIFPSYWSRKTSLSYCKKSIYDWEEKIFLRDEIGNTHRYSGK